MPLHGRTVTGIFIVGLGMLLGALFYMSSAPNVNWHAVWGTTFGAPRYGCAGDVILDSAGRRRVYANGVVCRLGDVGIALPGSKDMIGIPVVLQFLGREIGATIMDRGPWYVEDPYWETGERPLAEEVYWDRLSQRTDQRMAAQRDVFRERRPLNPAGIDLTTQAWIELGIDPEKALAGNFSGTVEWRFA